MKEQMDEKLVDEISIDDINIPHSLRRTVWLIRDVEDGNNYTADEKLDDKPEDVIFNMRSALSAAYKSNEHKYVCSFCNQPVGLKVRTNEGDFFPFFSHYQDIDEYCPLKMKYEIDPTRIVINAENKFKESVLHRNMVDKLEEVLKLSHNFKDVEIDKVISTPEVTGFRCPSLYSVYQENKKICFDALVSNPQLGLIVGRNAFYKMQKMFYFWIFPVFSTRHQRMCEKDILYMNRRNVFVFDSSEYYNNDANKDYLKDVKHSDSYKYAYEESLRQKRLMLNCYWQTPAVDDKGEVKIKWEGPELVAFDDLIFNEDSYETYFRDSDKDFYQTYSPEKQAVIDEWMRIKEDRWKNIFDSIERRKRLYEQALARREKRERLSYYYPLIESGEVVPIAFQDEKTKLWGYKVNDFEVIAPTYYDAKPFYQGYAWVRKSSYWGIIDHKGNRVLNFVYKDIKQISELIYKSRRKKHTELLDYKGTVLGIFDFINDFVDGKAKAGKYGKWENDGDWYHKDWHYIGNLGFIDEKGDEVYSYRELSNGLIVYSSSFENKCGLLDDKKVPITGIEYDLIEDFVEGKAKAKKNCRWGLIDEKGSEVYDCKTLPNGLVVYTSVFVDKCGLMNEAKERITGLDFDTIGNFINGKAKAKKDGKWGYVNEQGETMIPFEFDAIEEFVGGKAKAKKDNKWGYINEQGEALIPFEFDDANVFINGKAKARKNGKWGYIDENGNEIIQHKVLLNGLKVYLTSFENKIGLEDVNGEVITGLIYEAMDSFTDNMAKAKTAGMWGVINEKGELVIPFEFQALGSITNGLAKAKTNGKWGCINEEGKTIIPFNYDEIEYSEGKYKLIKYNGWRKRKKIVKIIDPANPNKTIDLSKVERNQIYTANVTGFHKIGMFIEIPEIGSALVPANQFKQTGKSMNEYKKGSQVRVELLDINEEKQRATFTIVNDSI